MLSTNFSLQKIFIDNLRKAVREKVVQNYLSMVINIKNKEYI